jgi:hypothetical protein
MAATNLKNIIGRKNDASSLLVSFIEQYKSDVSILDEEGNWIAGKPLDIASSFREAVVCEDKISGWVTGNEKSVFVSEFLGFLLKKEVDKKVLGTEVLHLYKEINLDLQFLENWPGRSKLPHCTNYAKKSMRVIRSTM